MEEIKNLIDFNPKVICEIGVFTADSIQCHDFLNDNVEFILVEANPKCYGSLKQAYNKSNFQIFNKAICDINGKIKLYNRGSEPDPSAHIESISNCPASINDGYIKSEDDSILCDACTFDKIDPGNIDILCVDIEGAEWFVLKHMISRPKIIKLEIHGGNYLNPFLNEIEKWMLDNNYYIIDQGVNDFVFKKKELE